MFRRRDFKVKVIDKDGNEITFEGKNCKVSNETIKQRFGIGDVRETIECERIEVKEEESND